MTNQQVHAILDTYGQAWMDQNPELILSIFTADASYQEGPFAAPMHGHEEIKKYWQKKVVQEQKDIHFSLLSIVVEGDRAAAEWKGSFVDLVTKQHVDLYEAAFLEFQDGKISSLRETWRSQRSPIL